jgi:tRNA threonylcarbamoyladenosine biosynthesis protein TsaB
MLLAIDTSTRFIGVALYDGTRVVYEAVWNSNNYHTVELAPTVSEALTRAGYFPSDLRAIGVAIGPGSFTSLRVGLAFAKGLALTTRVPLIGIPTLDVIAKAQPTDEMPLAAVIQAGRGRLAVGWYHVISDSWRSSGEVSVMDPKGLVAQIRKPTVICGELNENTRRLLRRKYKNAILASPAQSLRRPSFLAELAWGQWENGQIDDPAALSPIYLHHNQKEKAR